VIEGLSSTSRGDVAGDVIDTYTHNWGDRVRETYLESILSPGDRTLAVRPTDRSTVSSNFGSGVYLEFGSSRR